jgi:hypothetical protein
MKTVLSHANLIDCVERNFAVGADVGQGTAAAPIGVRFSSCSFNTGALGAAGG